MDYTGIVMLNVLCVEWKCKWSLIYAYKFLEEELSIYWVTSTKTVCFDQAIFSKKI